MFSPIVTSPSGPECFVPVQVGHRIETRAISIDGTGHRVVAAGDRCVVPLGATSGRLLLAISTAHEPVDLWICDHDGNGLRRLTALNEDAFGPDRHFEIVPLEVTGTDGQPVDAWFQRPVGSTGAVPTVLKNHGGPHAAWGRIIDLDDCLLAQAGYGVLKVNNRGSIGYSPEFATSLHGDYTNHDMSDLTRAVDSAVADGHVDASNLAVWGASGGGYLTAWLITHEDRFKAAVIESPHINWMTQLGADVGWFFLTYLQSQPGAGTAGYSRLGGWSPDWFANDCRTPTLIMQHESDRRTPPANADTLFCLLKLAKCPVEMLRFPGSPHAGSSTLGDPAVRAIQHEAMIDWFDRHLGGSDDVVHSD
jgi:dipeptidyl aminopeptidase/acylaminoacyl peptidase